MTTWTTYEDDDGTWDQLLGELGGTSPFSTSGWARTKSSGRWVIARLVAIEGGNVVAAAQVFYLKIPGIISIGWVPGGIVSKEPLRTREFFTWFAQLTQTKVSYLRLAFHRRALENDEQLLITSGWTKCPSFIGALETFVIKRSTAGLADLSRLSSNWKRNLERGLKRNNHASLCLTPNANEIAELMREMIEFKKKMGPRTVTTADALRVLFLEMQDHIVVVEVRDSEGQIRAVRGAFVTQTHAWDALAAASVDARKDYSSYVCAWKLVEELEERGVVAFDLAGIDEIHNAGVFNFKKGLGGERTRYLGEWDCANSRFARHLARMVISRLG